MICQETIAVFKEYNIKRHYDSKHSRFSEITGQIRRDKIVKLKSNLRSQSSTFIKKVVGTENIIEVSYELSDLIAKEMKPFSDGEFLKRGILIAVNTLCPEKKHLSVNQ